MVQKRTSAVGAVPATGRQTIRVTALAIRPQSQVSDLVFVCDVSASMGEMARGGKRKLPAAVEAALGLARIKGRLDPQGRIAIVSFSDDAETNLAWSPASDVDSAGRALQLLHTIGGTSIAAGLRCSERLLKHCTESTPRYAVLLSDGHANSGDDCVNVAESLKRAGVVIYGVGIGAAPADIDPRLPEIASPDKYVFLSDVQSLISHFEFVARETSIRSTRAPL